MDPSHLAVLRLVAQRPRQPIPPAMHAVAVRLLNFQLIHLSGRGFTIDPEGIEALVRSDPIPSCVQDLIERARRPGETMAP
jgi:hypothetical protein